MILEEDIKKLIGLPESNRLRYEAVLPSTNEVGRLIAGFANTAGGTLILGILNKNKKITVTGLSKDFQVNLVLQNAIKKLTPIPSIEYRFIDYGGKHLFALKVDKSDEMVAYDQVNYGVKRKEIYAITATLRNNSPMDKLDDITRLHSSAKPYQKSIFISYNWTHKETATKLYDYLINAGYSVKIDNHVMRYKDQISSFMASIRESDFAILIISDEYLKSANCMTEVLHILKEKDCIKKILPIRHANVKFFKTHDRLAYVTYWTKQVEETEELLKGIDATLAIEELKKLKTIKVISQEINDFLSTLSDMITNTIEEQERDSYREIINYIQTH
jgi:hypothetical protein